MSENCSEHTYYHTLKPETDVVCQYVLLKLTQWRPRPRAKLSKAYMYVVAPEYEE